MTAAPVLDAVQRDQVEAALRRACGLALSPALRSTLDVAVSRASAALGLPAQELLRRVAAQDAPSVGAVVEHALVGETYFFRHPEHFKVFRRVVLQPLGPGDNALIWSAGCASGEEPYTLAAELVDSRMGPGVHVLATDISELALERARIARYPAWSLRALDPECRRKLFVNDAVPAHVRPELKKRVTFARHNLIADPPPASELHAVFCRNVLIYFDPPTAMKVVKGMVEALRPEGMLFLGPAEVGLAAGLPLTWLDLDGALVGCKTPPDSPRAHALRGSGGRLATAPMRARPPTRAPVRAAPRPAAPPAPPVAPVPQVVAPPVLPAPAEVDRFEQARHAARAGRTDEAERIAVEMAAQSLRPEPHLLLAMIAEERGDLGEAIAATRRALYLDERMPMAHAALASLLRRAGQSAAAARARKNALALLATLDPGTPLRGVETLTAGALQRALADEEDW